MMQLHMTKRPCAVIPNPLMLQPPLREDEIVSSSILVYPNPTAEEEEGKE